MIDAGQLFTPRAGQTLIAAVPGDAAREVSANRAVGDLCQQAEGS
jgi:hypothetical protein